MANIARATARQAPSAIAPIDLHEELVYTSCDDVGYQSHEHTFAAMLARDPRSQARLPLLVPRITSVHFMAHKIQCHLYCRDSQDHRLISLEKIPDQDVAVYLDVLAGPSARDVARLLAPGARGVTTFALCTDFDNLSLDDIMGMFANFPSLETLRLDGRSSLKNVWAALTPVYEPAGVSDTSEVVIPCPKLKAIKINGDVFYSDDGFFEELLPMLRERDACGNRLQVLKLTLMPSARDEDDAEVEDRRVQAEHIPQLEQVVDEVTYYCIPWEVFDWKLDAGF